MPGAKELAKYFDVQDKYGVRVGDWAMQAAPGVASCSICPDVRVKFGKGKEVLTRHSESDRHTGNQKSVKQQFSIILVSIFTLLKTNARTGELKTGHFGNIGGK